MSIDIPANQIVPLDTIAHGIVGLRVIFVNVFGLMNECSASTRARAAVAIRSNSF